MSTTAKAPAKRIIHIEVSPELLALIRGFAGYYRQSPTEYVVGALLKTVEADCDARLDKHLPESRRG